MKRYSDSEGLFIQAVVFMPSGLVQCLERGFLEFIKDRGLAATLTALAKRVRDNPGCDKDEALKLLQGCGDAISRDVILECATNHYDIGHTAGEAIATLDQAVVNVEVAYLHRRLGYIAKALSSANRAKVHRMGQEVVRINDRLDALDDITETIH